MGRSATVHSTPLIDGRVLRIVREEYAPADQAAVLLTLSSRLGDAEPFERADLQIMVLLLAEGNLAEASRLAEVARARPRRLLAELLLRTV